jgi:YVTN family beta-propeller protein
LTARRYRAFSDSVASVIDTATNKIIGTIGHAGPEPEFVAITPDGAKAYVVGVAMADIPVIDTSAGRVTEVVKTDTRYSLITTAMSPDGKLLYVGNACSQVFVISTAANKVIHTIKINGPGQCPLDDIAISPDGKKLYGLTSNLLTLRSSISVIDTATDKVTGHIGLPHYAGDFSGLFTPDGKFAYVTLQDHSIGVIDTSADAVVSTVGIRGVPRGPAVTPDQAPVARMTVSPAPAGQRTRLDASSSTVRYGNIARYAWNFGDDTTATTTRPVTTHVYAAPGTYTVKLTETSSGGTSTTKVFTGETVCRNGDPSAVTTKTAVIHPPTGPGHRSR